MSNQRSADFLAIAIENAELRQTLAEAQDQCVELAVDAGELQSKQIRSSPGATSKIVDKVTEARSLRGFRRPIVRIC